MKLREEYDVVVVGAGTAGAIAAIAAARTGAKTLVVEQYASIGGVLTLGQSLLGTSDAEGYMALGGIGGELFDRLVPLDGGTRTSIDPLMGSVAGQDPEMTKLVLLEMAEEAGVQFLLHSFMAEVLTDGQKVGGVMVANKAGLEVIAAKTFVDCSGDADVTARAGGQFVFGREQDGVTQPVTNIFRLGGVDVTKLLDYLEEHPEDLTQPEGFSGQIHSVDYLRKTPGATIVGLEGLIGKARAAGDWTIPRDAFGIFTLPGRGEVGINVTRIHGIDGTNPDDISRAEIEAQKQTVQAVRFLRKYVPGFENARLISTPYQIGVRETRHIKGSYVLTADDVMSGADFEDQIGRGAYPLDIHDTKPGAAVANRVVKGGGITLWKIERSYGIPSRCLVPLGVENVTVGGRSISATHEAAGSIRGQAVCMVTGHAAGTLAALSAKQGGSPAAVPVDELQAELQAQGAILQRDPARRVATAACS